MFFRTPTSLSVTTALAVALAADVGFHAWSLLQTRASAQTPARDRTLPAFVDVAERLRPSVVNVSKQSTTRVRGTGTGVDSLGSGVILTADGYIATNAHVINESETVFVRLSNKDDYIAAVVHRDLPSDVAVMKIDPQTRIVPAALQAQGQTVRVGEWVVAIGSPFALDQTVTAGIISATGRVIGSGPYDTFLQTDAAINAGNSGGPLVNVRGEVVGLSAASIGGVGVSGIGFAVPVDAVRRALDTARARK
jgi:serine protease Do